MEFLDKSGVQTLWNKIKSMFVHKTLEGGIEISDKIVVNNGDSGMIGIQSKGIVSDNTTSTGRINCLYLAGPELPIIDFVQPTSAEAGIEAIYQYMLDQGANTIMAFGRVTAGFEGCSYILVISNGSNSTSSGTLIVMGSDALDDDYNGAKKLYLKTIGFNIHQSGAISWWDA